MIVDDDDPGWGAYTCRLLALLHGPKVTLLMVVTTGSPIYTKWPRSLPNSKKTNAGKAGADECVDSFRARRILSADSIVQVSYRSSSTSLH